MKNSDYWKQRFEQLEVAQNQIGGSALGEIVQQYNEAQKQIEGQIARWYQRFADNNGITMAEARKWLSASDLKELKWDVQEYIKYGQDNALMGGWMKELENASAKYHISKLEALKIQTQQSLEVMFSKQLGTMTGAMQDVLESGYFHTIYELQNGFGIGWDIAGLDQKQIEKVLSKPWAADGYNFSERIWNNKQKLISEVHSELTQNIMLGADPQKAIDSLAKKMKTSKNNAGRLVMTEEAYFSSVAQKEAFNELDVEQYEIVATLDSHTSEICRSLDGQVFPMKDYEAGVTAPPFHVYCRSTTVPHFDENFGQIGERAARDEETGKTYYIPDDMNYQDWKKTFVDGGDKSGFDVVDDGSALHYSHHKEPDLKNKSNDDTIKQITFREFRSGDEVNEFFYFDDEKRGILAKKNSSYGKWESSLSVDQKAAVSNYSAGGYSDLNSYLRHTNDWEHIDKQMMEMFKADLQSVTSSFELKEPIKVYRYTGLDTFGRKSLNELVGTEFIDDGFMSTSPIFEGVENAVITGKDILLEISVPSGKGYGAYINNLSAWKDTEYEFLFNCGAKFDIVSIDASGDVPIVRMVAK